MTITYLSVHLVLSVFFHFSCRSKGESKSYDGIGDSRYLVHVLAYVYSNPVFCLVSCLFVKHVQPVTRKDFILNSSLTGFLLLSISFEGKLILIICDKQFITWKP